MRDPYEPYADELAAAAPTPVLTPTAAELRQRAIANCRHCDTDGYRGTHVCDHNPDHIGAAARGMAAIRATMGWQPTKPSDHPESPPESRTAPGIGIQAQPKHPE